MGAPRIAADLRADRLALNEQTLSGDGSAAIRAELEAGRIQLEGDLLGVVSLAGDGRLDAEGLDLAIGIEGEALEELFQLGGGHSETEFAGRFEGTVTVQSEFEDFESWSASAELAEFELTYREFSLQGLEPVVVESHVRRGRDRIVSLSVTHRATASSSSRAESEVKRPQTWTCGCRPRSMRSGWICFYPMLGCARALSTCWPLFAVRRRLQSSTARPGC